MNDQTNTDHDQADEDILTYDVSDEVLEAASGTEGVGCMVSISTCRFNNPGCGGA
jgi:hypothetical protein